jgi:hypothetical protein
MTKMLFREGFLLAHENFPQGGACLEFGVASGRTYLWQVNQLISKFPNSTLIGFDSWQGLPKETEGVWCPGRHAEGKFSFPKTCVVHALEIVDGYEENKHRFRFVDGFYEESLTEEVRKTIGKAIFINIDVDIYLSTMQLLDFVKPLLQKGTVLYWDDWLDPSDVPHASGSWGEHRAWKEWSERNPDIAAKTVKVNDYNQRIMKIL